MVAAGAGAVVLLLLIVLIASAGGDGADESSTAPTDLGVPTTPASRDEPTGTTDTETTEIYT